MTDSQAVPSSAPTSSQDTSVGDTLRRTREAQGLSISEVANALKLNARQIEALESGRFALVVTGFAAIAEVVEIVAARAPGGRPTRVLLGTEPFATTPVSFGSPAAAFTKSRTEYCTPLAMTKSSGCCCCSIAATC